MGVGEIHLSILEVILLVLGVLGAIGGVVIIGQVIRHMVGRRPEAPATKSDVKQMLDEFARGTAPGMPQPDTAELAAQATESTEKQLEEALELLHAGEYREAIEGVLTAYDQKLSPTSKSALHVVAGNAFFGLSEYGAAEAHYREALRAAPSAGTQAAATAGLGLVCAGRGDSEEAEEHHRKALDLLKGTGSRLGQANALGNIGLMLVRRGDSEGAEEHFREALAIHEEIGDRLGQANLLGNLGNMCAARGDADGAEEHYRKALNIFEEIGDRLGQARGLGNLGNVCAERGDLKHAEEHQRKALDIDEEIGNRLGQAQRLANLGVVQERRGDLESAKEHYRSALEIAEEIRAAHLVGQIGNLLEGVMAVDD